MSGVRALRRALPVVCAGVTLVLPLLAASSAQASSVWWGLTSGSWPANLAAASTGKLIVTAQNRGYGEADAGIVPVVVSDALPPGLEVVVTKTGAPQILGFSEERGPVACTAPSPHVVECRFGESAEDKPMAPGEQLEVQIGVRVVPGASSGEENAVSVSGGGGPSRAYERPIAIGEESDFGVENYELLPEEEAGITSTQAGAHPFQLTSVIALNTSEAASNEGKQEEAGLVKDLTFQLPPGLIGNPTPLPQCTGAQFVDEEANTEHDECPADTAIGLATITVNTSDKPIQRNSDVGKITVPLFNLTPLRGEPARFGFDVAEAKASAFVTLDTSVRSGSDYGVTVKVGNITELAGFLGAKVIFWGTPGSPIHDRSRGWNCIEARGACAPQNENEPPPFLSLPTSCSGPMRTSAQADSWEEPQPENPSEAPLFAEYQIGGLDGCNRLPFDPSIRAAPDVPSASTSTGLSTDVHVSQTAVLNAEGLAESAVKDITVALPEGVGLNPSGADGLEACSEAQVGFTGVQGGMDLFTGGLPQPFCADSSKIGTVEIKTPLLPNPLEGAVYLAAQNANPFGSLVAMYLVAEDPVSGTLVRLAGEVSLNQTTGQVTATFKNSPELAFEDAELHFFGGERAPLATPAHCGTYTTRASFAPWSGTQTIDSSSSFEIESGPNGGPCPGTTLPFEPSLTAGTTSNQAGGFSPFTLTMSRPDGHQNLQSIALHMPPGLTGTLDGIKLCDEADANAGTCPPESLIGETVVSVGVGNDPFSVTGGRVYLTEKYEGAPFGLSIVNPAKAGPFDLGQVIVRAKIEVDPTTADLTVTTDPTGPYAIPHILDGIPLQIKHVNVTITRHDFTFNPTNCNPLAVTGTLGSVEGAAAAVSVPYQATNCAILGFKPGFSVSTPGKPTRTDGVGLSVKLSYPSGSFTKDANVAKVKVELPKQLPSRLTTLQKACTDAVFNANPAACPPASRVGEATATTPLVPVALSGPAYFVSHGGAKFPELIIVLSGYGVTVYLHGETFISKAGITSSTFNAVPDVPVGSFQLTLPQGPYSALAANGDLCAEKLVMPTTFSGQNGVRLEQSTPISVQGCQPQIRVLRHRVHGRKATVVV
ncbi:MAG: hypothetical protein FWD42_08295, partial [Solirubrobacterales bacterium]|nr:hypothetical protein [Solirubrobacterales bacterium]